MTTINGVTFNMRTLEPVATHRNIPNEEPGSDESFINDMGYAGLVLRVTGYETTLAKYDEVISEFMKTGAQTLVYRTGWQFSVYSTRLIPMLDVGIVDNWFPYELIMITSTPYRESTSSTTRSKTITANNQEWSADDSANDVDTDGSVDAVPDIEVTGGFKYDYDEAVDIEYSTPAADVCGLAWDGSNIWSCDDNDNIYKHNDDMTVAATHNSPGGSLSGITWDGSNIWSCDSDTDKIYKYNTDMTVNTTYDAPATTPTGLAWDGSNIWSCDSVTDKIYKHNSDMTVNTTYDAPATAIFSLAYDGTNFWSTDVTSDKIYKHKTDITVDTTYDARSTFPSGVTWDGFNLWSCDSDSNKIYKHNCKLRNDDVDVYNTSDSTVKCRVGDEILYTAIHRINVDGTGTIEFNDDFTTTQYNITCHTLLNVTRDGVNNELDIADDGYIYWKCDAKYPVTGIPTLTSRINITSGTPTIQISSDAATWYDITTAIVDDVNTVYDLDSTSLSLKGRTDFYWRYDCVKAGAATCSIKSFELYVDLVTIDVEHPVINTGGSASTFRCDQDAASGMNCTVALIYRDRSWPA